MNKKTKIKWLKNIEKQDYPGAVSFLSLIYNEETAAALIRKLKNAPLKGFKAKDIFRASELPALEPANLHVQQDRKKIKKGIRLSPILLVRDSLHGKVIIADGYHRMCAVYSFDEDAVIPCKIISAETAPVSKV